jgi:hypothetical protein
MQAWAAEELRSVDLGDARLNRRVVRIVEALAAQPTASVPQAAGDWAGTKAIYRFWDSAKVSVAAIHAAHRARTVERVVDQRRVLAIQDTTEFDFRHHPQTRGLGPISVPSHPGFKLHSTLAVSLEGVPLGIVDQQTWVRDPAEVGKAKQRRHRPITEKESLRWLTALEATLEAIPATVGVITVADAESDIFELFAHPRRPGAELLLRATHDRRLSDAAEDAQRRYLWETVRASAPVGQVVVEVGRREDTAPRRANLTVRFTTVTIQPPRHHEERTRLSPVRLQAILVAEEQPPADVEPICWLLLTTLPVSTFAQAVECVHWYTYRWLIERYHFVLKSGCTFEALQLGEAARLMRALGTYAIVAWRLLWLTYLARRQPNAPCDRVLEAHEWQALVCLTEKTSVPPCTPPPLRDAVRAIAHLGGFLGRTRDGEPGVKTIWRGLTRLHDIAHGWQLREQAASASAAPLSLMGKA